MNPLHTTEVYISKHAQSKAAASTELAMRHITVLAELKKKAFALSIGAPGLIRFAKLT